MKDALRSHYHPYSRVNAFCLFSFSFSSQCNLCELLLKYRDKFTHTTAIIFLSMLLHPYGLLSLPDSRTLPSVTDTRQRPKNTRQLLCRVALGEEYTVFLLPAKPALPSAFSRALGKPLPCAKPHSAKKVETGRTNRQTGEQNGTNGTGSKTLPSARRVALGKDSNFAECQAGSTRRSFELRRVLPHWHSAEF